jgi:hypothetical protein
MFNKGLNCRFGRLGWYQQNVLRISHKLISTILMLVNAFFDTIAIFYVSVKVRLG